MPWKQGGRLSSFEVSVFCEQTTLLLQEKIPIHEGIGILYRETEKKRLKRICKELDQNMKKHMSLYQALQKSEAVPEYMVCMVKIGEETGRLGEVMASLTTYYKRETHLKESIKNLVCYPIMLFYMMGVLIVLLAIKILPMFERVMYELGAQIPGSAQTMVAASSRITQGLSGIFFLLFTGMVVVMILYRTRSGNRELKRIGNHMPYLGRMRYQLEQNQFISAMSIMVESGLSVEQALEVARKLSRHPEVKKKIICCQKSRKPHKSLETSLQESGLITKRQERMIGMGTKKRGTKNVFEQLVHLQEAEIKERLNAIAAAVETILVIVLFVMIGVILSAVLVPFVSIISSIG